jgi:hypothetical protein
MKHNKYRNVGVIFESLIHYTMKMISEGKIDKATTLIKIIKANFINNTKISECCKIYSQLLYSEAINYYHASKFYSRLINEHNKLDHSAINAEISSMFSVIKESFDLKSIMNTKIPNYKLFSSFRISSGQDNNYLSSKDNMVVDTEILEHLIKNKELKRLKETNIKTSNKTNEEIRTDKLANMIAFKKFEQEYKNKLNEAQKNFLIKYYSSDDKVFKEWADKKINFLMNEISDKILSIDDENIIKKLSIFSERLSYISKLEKINAEGFTDLMMGLKLKEYLETV